MKAVYLKYFIFFIISLFIFPFCKKENNEIKDTSPPVIKLIGNPVEIINFDSTYNDKGATAIDDIDGKVNIITDNPVNTANAGEYKITYSATDKAGNTSKITRIVYVKFNNFNIAGDFITSENCNDSINIPYKIDVYECSVSCKKGDSLNLSFENFGRFNTPVTLNAVLYGNTMQTFNISKQTANNVIFEGEGIIDADGKKLTISYTATGKNIKDNCTAIWIKK